MSRWHPPERSAEARALYAAAEEDRRAHPGRYALAGAADEVVAHACRDADPTVLGAEVEWRPGLERYLASAAADARLNAVGARTARQAAVGKLRTRRALRELVASHPSLPERPLDPPIVIVGGWRTGTTFLFRCLATDPRLRAPLPGELARPWRFVGVDRTERERLIDASGAAHDLLHLLNPALEAVHSSGARLPEECVLALGTDMRSWGFPSTMRLPGYVTWLTDQDLRATYRDHRLVLQALDAGDGRRWVLKAPAHTAELPALAAAFPGATIVHLHRDIVETVASGASLFATFHSTYSDHVDPYDVGRSLTDQTELWFRRAAAFAGSPGAATVTVVDLTYAELVDDPVGALARVYAAAGQDPPPDLPAFVAAYHRSHPRHGHGPHRYTAEQFGIDPTALRERFAFHDDLAP